MSHDNGGRAFGSQFLVDDYIGSGSMGRVYRGRVRESGESVAIKILREDLSSQPDIVARFIRERQVLRAVQHVNVVGVRDLVVEADQLGIVMDLIEGGDLRHALPTAVSAGYSLYVVAQIADGLGAVHGADVVHRDLKPENILADRWPDGTIRPRLTDFGVSRLISQSMTKVTSLIGTPGYLSPEATRGHSTEAPSDIYALGCITFELLCGRPPFVADNILALMRAHAEDPVPRPPGVPDELWTFIESMLAKQPEDRPTAHEVSGAARHLMESVGDVGPFPMDPAVVPLPDQVIAPPTTSSTPVPSRTVLRTTSTPIPTVLRDTEKSTPALTTPPVTIARNASRSPRRRAVIVGIGAVVAVVATFMVGVMTSRSSNRSTAQQSDSTIERAETSATAAPARVTTTAPSTMNTARTTSPPSPVRAAPIAATPSSKQNKSKSGNLNAVIPSTTYTTPVTTTTQPQPTTTQPRPTTTQPKPTTTQPRPTTTQPKPTTTTTTPPPSVFISKGTRKTTSRCGDASCAWVVVTVSNMSGPYTVTMYDNLDYWGPSGCSYPTSSTTSQGCVFGYPGLQIYVTVNGVQSNILTW